jgi:Polyketide cyclase / dehydrase and lipid transport
MIALGWEADIAADADEVFSLLVELRDYGRWLPDSSAYHGTLEISDGPIRVGTTYIEPGPLGTRIGRVTKLIRPTALNFEQPMTMRASILGVIGICLFHTISPQGHSTHLVRRLVLSPRGPVKLATPLVVRAFAAENERMMQALKTFAETQNLLSDSGRGKGERHDRS